ncbi:alpha-tocopherol transfer protein-like [Adelges cooleyi]|uniref:alpha-tocopherol transfer protein-like n=1 Tax=Adelges cooleyi TaxID=133065 RepID=UPI00217F6738|nr:alpha-tocopherol transfer protein-like [Adelges cooleyi]
MYTISTSFNDYFQGEQKKYPQLKLKDVIRLKVSLTDEKELPPVSDKYLIAFLHSCYYDVEAAKSTIKRYYKTCFTLPEIFCDIDPTSEPIRGAYECTSLCDLTFEQTDNKECFLYWQFKNTDPQAYNCEAVLKYFLMFMDYKILHYGLFDGMNVIINCQGSKWRHVLNTPMNIMAELFKYMQKGIPVRIKTIHFINSGSIVDRFFGMLTPFIDKEIFNKIKFYPTVTDDFFNVVPINLFPVEAGGLGLSHNFLNDKMFENVKSCREWYKERNQQLQKQLFINKEKYMD